MARRSLRTLVVTVVGVGLLMGVVAVVVESVGVCDVPRVRVRAGEVREADGKVLLPVPVDGEGQELPAVFVLEDAVWLERHRKEMYALTKWDALLRTGGHEEVLLSASNTHSKATVRMPLKEYMEALAESASRNATAEETVEAAEEEGHCAVADARADATSTYYFFGSNAELEFIQNLERRYTAPAVAPRGPSASDSLLGYGDQGRAHEQQERQQEVVHPAALSFGIGGKGSGVCFHIHGPGFSEVFHGRKRWFLTLPDQEPEFDPDESMFRWVEAYDKAAAAPPSMYDRVLEWLAPLMPARTETPQRRRRIWDCTIQPGEILYFPDRYWHGTLNLDDFNVFMSTFL